MKQARFLQAKPSGGFTFVEVFAAMVFLAILVPAIAEGLAIANRASVVAERGEIAGELAENKLNEMLLDNAWETAADNKGEFGTDWPGYRWEMNQQTWDQDTANPMTQLTVKVYFPVQGAEHNFQLDTLVTTGTTQTTGTGQSM